MLGRHGATKSSLRKCPYHLGLALGRLAINQLMAHRRPMVVMRARLHHVAHYDTWGIHFFVPVKHKLAVKSVLLPFR